MEFGNPDNFFVPSLQADHYDVGILPFVSALINGKGNSRQLNLNPKVKVMAEKMDV